MKNSFKLNKPFRNKQKKRTKTYINREHCIEVHKYTRYGLKKYTKYTKNMYIKVTKTLKIQKEERQS